MIYAPLFSYLYIYPISFLFMLKRKRRPPTLKRILSRELSCSRRCIYVSDPHFDLVSDKDMQTFVAWDKTNEKQWKKNIWDCDNFSLQFAASAQRYFAQRNINAAIGIIWTKIHAFNLSINPEFKVRLWEPQTDKEHFLNARVQLVII